MATSLEYLQALRDPATGTNLYTFTKATDYRAPVSLPSATYVVPGVHGGLNPRGTRPNQIAPRTVTQRFVKVYDPTNTSDTWVATRDALWKAAGNRRVQLVVAEPNGSTRINYGALTDFPQEEKPEDRVFSTFELTFALESAFWKGPVPVGYVVFDGGYQYDTGLIYDGNNTVALSGVFQTLTLVNGGDAPDYEPRIAVFGPYDGPILIANLSITYPSGLPMQMWYAGSLGATDNLYIDVQAHRVLRNGVPDFGNFTWGKDSGNNPTGQTEWFRLDPGSNVIEFAHASGSAGGHASLESYDSFI